MLDISFFVSITDIWNSPKCVQCTTEIEFCAFCWKESNWR